MRGARCIYHLWQLAKTKGQKEQKNVVPTSSQRQELLGSCLPWLTTNHLDSFCCSAREVDAFLKVFIVLFIQTRDYCFRVEEELCADSDMCDEKMRTIANRSESMLGKLDDFCQLLQTCTTTD